MSAKSKKNTERINVFFSPDVLAHLKEEASEQGMSVSGLVRMIVLGNHGKWIEEPNCWFRCSKCGDHHPSLKGYMSYKYCPNCGAKMDA